MPAIRLAEKEARALALRLAASDVADVWQEALKTRAPVLALRAKTSTVTVELVRHRARKASEDSRVYFGAERDVWCNTFARVYTRFVNKLVDECALEWECSIRRSA
jgi:hypothetical protein